MKNVILALVAMLLMGSCTTPKVAYFQEVEPGTLEEISHPKDIRLQPEDKISIIVNSKDPLLVNLFNLPFVSRQLGVSATNSNMTSQGISGYTINQEGNIDFPVLGAVHVGGMTREEVASHIKKELIENNLVKDPVVTVEYMNLTVTVLGEVANPGRFSIDKDRLTLLDALSMAGDLTIYGKRDNVSVQREEGGKQVIYKVNINSGKELYASPVYYLQQNDVIYVEPNSVRARQSTVNGNNIRSASFWMSLASLLTTIVVLFVK